MLEDHGSEISPWEVGRVYAIVETGGKQYKVAVGDTIDVEKLPVQSGDKVELDRVLMVQDGDKTKVGNPLVNGAKVVATVVGPIKGPKIRILKYKPKIRYRRTSGHRQNYTRLSIDKILKGRAAARKKA